MSRNKVSQSCRELSLQIAVKSAVRRGLHSVAAHRFFFGGLSTFVFLGRRGKQCGDGPRGSGSLRMNGNNLPLPFLKYPQQPGTRAGSVGGAADETPGEFRK